MTVVYKVFNPNPTLRSMGDVRIEYEQGKDYASEHVPFLAFDTLEHAEATIRMNLMAEIYECEASNPIPVNRLIHVLCLEMLTPKNVEDWWRGHLELDTQPAPIGTVACFDLHIGRRVDKFTGLKRRRVNHVDLHDQAQPEVRSGTGAP